MELLTSTKKLLNIFTRTLVLWSIPNTVYVLLKSFFLLNFNKKKHINFILKISSNDYYTHSYTLIYSVHTVKPIYTSGGQLG